MSKPGNEPDKDDNHHAAPSSQPAGDPDEGDANERTDTKEEIAHPGSHGGAGAPGRKQT